MTADAREELFRSPGFRAEAAERLGHDARRVASCLDILLEAGRLPSLLEDNSAALATDGSLILCAIGSQQTRPESVIRVTDRFCAMKFQCDLGRKANTDRPNADIMGQLPSTSFANDLAALFHNLWIASRGASAFGFRPTAVHMLWSDERGRTIFGVIEQWSTRRKRIYSNANLPMLEGAGWDFVQLPSVGGTVFSPLSIVGFGELLDEGIAKGDTFVE
jgi:hypothetical protein